MFHEENLILYSICKAAVIVTGFANVYYALCFASIGIISCYISHIRRIYGKWFLTVSISKDARCVMLENCNGKILTLFTEHPSYPKHYFNICSSDIHYQAFAILWMEYWFPKTRQSTVAWFGNQMVSVILHDSVRVWLQRMLFWFD